MSTKYNFELDIYSDNSNSIILRHIQPNSKILEIGSAYGRMTKYLKEELNCDVHIVEVDEESGKAASQWAKESFIGKINGNIESPAVFNSLAALDIKDFDYIICADVLEHLHDPKTVLSNLKSLLKSSGSIWISIPNVAHNAVLIDLWNNKFTYRDVGLLDSTHIKFFTNESLEDMIYSCHDLKIENRHNLKNMVRYTEFNNSYYDVPLEIHAAMMNREYAEVYQFVWELKWIKS